MPESPHGADTRAILRRLVVFEKAVAAGFTNPTLREALREIVVFDVQRNFDEGGRPVRWPPSKRVQRSGGKTLILTGALRESFGQRVSATAREMVLTSPLPYAERMEKGAPGENVPARPFAHVSDEIVDLLGEATGEILTKGKAK